MGQAKRRKDLGLMPVPTQKPRKTARIKVDMMDGYVGMGGMTMLLSGLLMNRNSGMNFAMRSEMARSNRETEESA